MDGKIDELQAEYETSVEFPWQDVANHTAVFGWYSILDWMCKTLNKTILPRTVFVERACQNGHNVPVWVYKIKPNVADNRFSAQMFVTFAARGRSLEIMNWIYDILPNKVLPNMPELNKTEWNMTDDTRLFVLKWTGNAFGSSWTELCKDFSLAYQTSAAATSLCKTASICRKAGMHCECC
jgi:hypothetical protein